MKRDLKLNYAHLEMTYIRLKQYMEAIDTLVRTASVFSAAMQAQDSDAYERLQKYWDDEVTTDAAMLSSRLNLIAENLRSYIDAMTDYIAPASYGAQIRVDRNDIWFNYTQMAGISIDYLNILTDTGSSWDNYRRNFCYNPLESETSNNARRDRMHREDHEESCRRGRNYQKLSDFRELLRQQLSGPVAEQVQEIQKIYENKIIPYENTDDEYSKKIRELYDEWATIGDRIRENRKETLDVYRGGFAALKDLLVGALGLIKGVAEWQIYSLFGNWGWAPEWLETDISRMEQGAKLIFTDPEQVIETIGQNIFDTTDEEGVAYSVGYVTVDIALEILVDKGIDRLKTLNKAEDVIGIAEDTARRIGAEYTLAYAEAGEDFVRSVENIADAAEDLSQYAYTAENAGESLLQHLDDIDDISGGVSGAAQGIVTGNGTSILDDLAEDAVKRGTVPEGGTVTINPNEIRYSQSSVNGSNEIIDSMKQNGWKGDPIDVVEMPDGVYTTIDNTRVVSAREAGIDVQAIHNYNDPLPIEYVERFTTKQGVPTTWGEAIELRIGKQKATFRNANPFGSFEMENIK